MIIKSQLIKNVMNYVKVVIILWLEIIWIVKKCINWFHILYGTNNCFDETLLDQGYYLMDDIFFPCEKNCKTCSNSKTNINNIMLNNCLSCDELKNLFLVSDLKNCEPESITKNGYYIKLKR